ncbi:MAG TPA: hypothetical protein VF808_04675 [Ktedonobacterales bacterium]
MRTRRLALIAMLVALLIASSVYVATGLRVFANYRHTYGAYALACDGTLAWNPPRALYAGLYVNQSSFVTVRVRSSTPTLAYVTVAIPGYSAGQQLELQTGATFQSLDFKPQLITAQNTGEEASARTNTLVAAAVVAKGRPTCTLNAPLTIFGRQWMRWRDPATHEDLTPYIAGWVTPQSPLVATLAGKAAGRLRDHPELYDNLPALFGYDQGSATGGQVRDQVNAIFDTLQFEYHVRYSADNPPFTSDSAQIVLSPDDILGASAPTGMCVETTALIASAVERLGMRPYIVFTATHAYLGVALSDTANGPIAYWETSDLNGSALGAQANVDGDATYAQDVTTHAITDVVDIQAERAHGIAPSQ